MKQFLFVLGLALCIGLSTNLQAQDSLNVRMIGSYGPLNFTTGVAVQDTFAYLADADSGLRIINIANPTSPIEVGKYSVGAFNAEGVAVQDTFAYVAGWVLGRLRVINVADPTSPSEVGFENTQSQASAVALSSFGNVTYAYVASTSAGLRIIEVTVPSSPTEVGFYDTPGSALGVAVLDTFVYVADADSGLRIINFANPANPVEVGFYDTPGYAFGVTVVDTFAYVADGGSGLRIINVSDPSSPFEAGFFDTGGLSSGVTVSGNLAYVGDAFPGLRIFDVSDPTSPTEVGYYDGLGMNYTFEAAVSGNYIYAVDRDAGFLILEYYGVGVEEKTDFGLRIAEFGLKQNQPNPYHRSTVISYSIPLNGHVILKVFDLTGRLVEILVDEKQDKGVYQVQWDGQTTQGGGEAKDQTSGIYFYRLQTGDFTATKKLILLR